MRDVAHMHEPRQMKYLNIDSSVVVVNMPAVSYVCVFVGVCWRVCECVGACLCWCMHVLVCVCVCGGV